MNSDSSRHITIYSYRVTVGKHNLLSTHPLPTNLSDILIDFFKPRSLTFTMSSRYKEPVRPFSCTLCSKSFNKRYELNNHSRVHTNERPYQCPEQGCDRTFRWRSSIRYHKSSGVCTRPLGDDFPHARRTGSGSKPSSSSRKPSAPSASARKSSTTPPQRKPSSSSQKKRHPHHHHASSSVRQGTGTDGVLLFNLDGMPPFSDPLSV